MNNNELSIEVRKVIDLNVLGMISSFQDFKGWKLPKIVRISGNSNIETLKDLVES